MQSIDESAWFHATTLAERLAAGPSADAGLKPAEGDVEPRLQAWKSQPPFHRPSTFEQRLAFDSLTESRLRDLLGEPMPALQGRMPEPPWLVTIKTALASSLRERLPALLPERLKTKPTIGFLTAAARFIERAVARLEDGAAALAASASPRLFEPSAVAKIFFPHLADALLDVLNPVMALELNIARLEGTLEGTTPEERFHSFLARLNEREHVAALLREYPVLARLLVQHTDRWVDVSLELMERLCRDGAALIDSFGREGHLGVLAGATGGLADPHRGGRSVIILKFSSGIRVVYRPKSVAVDAHFQALLRWLNARSVQTLFRDITVLDRRTYGWVEYVEMRECTDGEQVRRFYERQGANLALLYVLDATDFHGDNLIACGEHPVLIDLEGLFHPHRSRPTEDEAADRLARHTISRSVLNIGLLPERVWSNADNEGVDVSGLGTPDGQLTPHLLPQWEATGTDTMHLVRRRKTIGAKKNRPTLVGSAINVLDYRQAILDGFTATYRMLMAHRDELIDAHGPLALFEDDEVSVFLRSARTYRRLLRESYHPDVLHDALDRERLFDLLWIPIEEEPQLLQVVQAEREDLLGGDIPAFSTRPSSRDLLTSNGRIVPDFFNEAGMSAVHRRLRSLGDEDFARQRWFVDASLSTFSNASPETAAGPVTVCASDQQHGAPDHRRLLAAAEKVGDRLATVALRGRTDASWVGLHLDRDRFWSIESAGLDLYGGLPGIALFLAYLGHITGKEEYSALARAALETMQAQCGKRRASIRWIGGLDGWGGVIYALTHLGTLWRRDDLISQAEELVADLPALVERDEMFDVIRGAAGCIAALRCLRCCRPSDRITALAVQCGDHLLAHGEAMGSGIGWRPKFGGHRPLTGFAHGSAGIGWALLELSAWTGMERFHRAAIAARAYERSAFLEEAGNWPDLREHANGAGKDRRCPTAWCHGASGIGLSRLASLSLADDADVRAEITVAIATTLREGFGHNHSLCHGDLGNLELLVQAKRVLGHGLDSQIPCPTGSVLASCESETWKSGTPYGVETPGLMTGLAGIGYGLLRLADPDRVPSVLLLEPPRVGRWHAD